MELGGVEDQAVGKSANQDAFESVAGFHGDEDAADFRSSDGETVGKDADDAGSKDEQNGEGGEFERVQGSLLC